MPEAPVHGPAALKLLGFVTHLAFCAVLALMALSIALVWFGDMILAAQWHDVNKVVLLALIVLHVLAVPFHLFILKNRVMQQILHLAA